MKKEGIKKTLLNAGVKHEFIDKIVEKATHNHF